jgi:hypothetical protein
MDELKSDIRDIKEHVVELVRQGAVHNQILQEHEKRSTNLEARFAPIEDFHIFFSKASSIIVTLGGIVVALAALKELLHK